MKLWWSISLFLLAFSSCAPHKPPIVINKFPVPKNPVSISKTATEHTVSKGETLYSIAWSIGQDFHTLAVWNDISDPYTIYPGQMLKLRPGKGKKIKTERVQNPSSSGLKNSPSPETKKTSQVVNAQETVPQKAGVTPTNQTIGTKSNPTENQVKKWRWPSEGKVIEKYRPSSGVNGVRISDKEGSPITAAAPGEVVYVGEGLRGYGKLVLIKHNTTFLSAYAHNNSILVSEGQKVKSGQLIAKMGSSGATKTMLHFEIRKDGKPVDPLRYLK
ncbi:MAG: peptidoglycan DD-metalloendopeptidase family protein [Gammaproteobacteria bacterium]|nr:peptidoglycan DD-metalloendopeptidase family protein [Gammaproteobacteria bacterium]